MSTLASFFLLSFGLWLIFVFKGGVEMNDFSVEVNSFLYFSLKGFFLVYGGMGIDEQLLYGVVEELK